MNGFTGLAYPLRLNNKGGLKLSTTSSTDFSHIEESIRQIITTSIGERTMEVYFGSSLSSHVFDPTDESSYSLIRHEIVDVLSKLEPRISVLPNDISLENSIDDDLGTESLHITLKYKVIKYEREGIVSVDLGGRN